MRIDLEATSYIRNLNTLSKQLARIDNLQDLNENIYTTYELNSIVLL